ncbi:hypothetical protein ABL78_3650 [Leptomonas seymouri]|uniref:Uncharacterized protein n=1 Tax=Leptomonas seymouri TaxID=5684 RepID=A0A0N1IL72_LEPSE|nr:hypothetical protein ABL78_3650 [Leptomonas seymouri]|eukprot:KPI87255.1 hypothetical protein ABL78_3650 [Leptomonas seymouri]
MELRRFYGNRLLDYGFAVTTISCRHASLNFTVWRGGSITDSSTNTALVAKSLPSVLRGYWMSRRIIRNAKRLADCVESFFGVLSMALWLPPLRRRRALSKEGRRLAAAASVLGGVLCTVLDAPAPDASTDR